MSTLTVDLPPTGSTSPSCTARSSLTCTSSGRSPISSRNSVPECASTNLPVCLSVAPVNEPFSWPNRMLSTRLSGMAPQLTVTKGLRLALAGALDGARHQFLADARFAFDEDRDLRGRRLLRQPDDAVHGRAAGDDVLERDRPAALCGAPLLDLQRLDLEGARDGDAQPFGRCRLDDEIEGAGPHRRDDDVDAALRGLHDDGDGDVAFAHRLEHAEPVEPRHHQVEDDDGDIARAPRLERRQRGLAAFRHHRVVAETDHRRLQQPSLNRIVIDYEDGSCHEISGTLPARHSWRLDHLGTGF